MDAIFEVVVISWKYRLIFYLEHEDKREYFTYLCSEVWLNNKNNRIVKLHARAPNFIVQIVFFPLISSSISPTLFFMLLIH